MFLLPKLASRVIWVNGKQYVRRRSAFLAECAKAALVVKGDGKGWPHIPDARQGRKSWRGSRLGRKDMVIHRICPSTDPQTLTSAGQTGAPRLGRLLRSLFARSGGILAVVPARKRKDIRNAVLRSGRHGNGASWATTTGHLRAQILVLHGRGTCRPAHPNSSNPECDLQGGKSGTGPRLKPRSVVCSPMLHGPINMMACCQRCSAAVCTRPCLAPLGVIGADLPDEAPFAGPDLCHAARLLHGKPCVLIASEAFPLAATDF